MRKISSPAEISVRPYDITGQKRPFYKVQHDQSGHGQSNELPWDFRHDDEGNFLLCQKCRTCRGLDPSAGHNKVSKDGHKLIIRNWFQSQQRVCINP